MFQQTVFVVAAIKKLLSVRDGLKSYKSNAEISVEVLKVSGKEAAILKNAIEKAGERLDTAGARMAELGNRLDEEIMRTALCHKDIQQDEKSLNRL